MERKEAVIPPPYPWAGTWSARGARRNSRWNSIWRRDSPRSRRSWRRIRCSCGTGPEGVDESGAESVRFLQSGRVRDLGEEEEHQLDVSAAGEDAGVLHA